MPTTLSFSLHSDTDITLVRAATAGVAPRVGFLRIDYDRDAQNPCDDDGVGRIEVFSRRTVRDQVERQLKNPENVLLCKYEHGLVRWFVDGLEPGVIPDRQWDVSVGAGLWSPDESTRASCPVPRRDKARAAERRQWFREQAAAACLQYTDYCNGQSFVIALTVFEAQFTPDGTVVTRRDAYAGTPPVAKECCGGYLGWDVLEEGVADMLSDAAMEDADAVRVS